MQKQWQKFESFLNREMPEMFSDLNAACTEEELSDLEKKLKVQLPETFKSFYKVHDGQKGEQTGFFFGLRFLPLDSIYTHWNSWEVIIDQEGEKGIIELGQFCESAMPEKVKSIYANKKWIPFMHDFGGNHIGLDFDPNPEGVAGQIINFGRDEDQKAVLADSFEAFINWILDEIEKKNYVINREDGIAEFSLREPDLHFIDGAKDLILKKT